MVSNVKIIIVDDNAFFCESLKLLIEMEEIGSVVAIANDGQELIDLLDLFNPDLVILDVKMPVMDGLEATIKAINKKPGIKILILTLSPNENKLTSLINAGISGYMLKSSGKKELEKAIRTIIRGNGYFQNNRP